ncbi:glycoside hydrolase family 75 protein [Paraburkholderia sediminicola]|uniref:hypothetical protein n=1 Tax=Paraburkholderia sediminicola TaxID=458836 RepID=UPI0038B8FF3D
MIRNLGCIVGILAVNMLVLSDAYSQTCPLSAPESSSLPRFLDGHGVLISQSPAAVLFMSGVERDEDGAPKAYHVGMADGGRDPGMDAICDGGDVLEFHENDRQLYNRYAKGGSEGKLSGVSSDGKTSETALCKHDYITIRDAGFPPCGPDHLCMRWYGVAVSPLRSCGYNYSKDMGCGVPVKQVDANGKETGFYLTTNTLMRPGAPYNSNVQSDYADATQVPFIVMPGGLKLPMKATWAAGDLAVVAWHGHVAYAVVGDSGPSNKIGEASRALLAELSAWSISANDPATTLVFPGTAHRIRGQWPLTKDLIRSEAAKFIEDSQWRGALPRCAGLERLH